jgi:hypothetical protein
MSDTIDLHGNILTIRQALADITVTLMDIAEMMPGGDNDALESAANLTRGVHRRVVKRETLARVRVE